MPKNPEEIEAINDTFENVVGSVVKPRYSGLKEITPKSSDINKLPAKTRRKEITKNAPEFDFVIDCQTESQGIGMGVLRDGTPFLNQRGLASLCGVENAHIGTVSSQWNDENQRPRILKIKELLASRGLYTKSPHIEASDGSKTYYAYPDAVCLAILEYYAFEAGSNSKEAARKNFRILAGKALQDFIYAQVGYDPDHNLPEKWKQFHDRVSLAYNAVPAGYFSVFKEMADMIVTLGQSGIHISDKFVPDISVGMQWSKHWNDNNLSHEYGNRIEYKHNYPDYFPQSASNPQPAKCYPEAALGEFRRWMREVYIGEGKFENYLTGQIKKKALPVSFVQLAITAYDNNQT